MIEPEDLQHAVEVYNANGKSQRKTATALGMARESLQRRLKRAAELGLLLDHSPAMPGFRVSQVTDSPNGKFVQQKPERGEAFKLLPGHKIKGESALVAEDGRTIIKWVKTKEGELDPLQVAEWLKCAFADYPHCALPTVAPTHVSSNLATLIPVNDWHLNMSAWGKQVGNPWDLKIAEPVIGDAAVETIARTPKSAVCILLGGGDLLHVNGKANTTVNGTPQDTDSRFEKGVEVLGRLMVRTTDAALQHHQRVILRVLKGNHDEDSSIAIKWFLHAWYRNEPRVTIDLDPSDYFWFRFGKVLLGGCHGHQSSNHIAKMPGIMAHRRAEDWGATKFRYVHGFHLHHSAKIATEGEGVICEIHQAPIPQDAWHFNSGFLSGRSMQGITYHKDLGEISRVRTAILDAGQAA